ncbi:MAG: glycosyltransferase family 2 protein [Candidatus Woesearchaeota archaeon]|nr:glycosyltransferase family 2 protein [Candidatus Woesearchaeota archaeon]
MINKPLVSVIVPVYNGVKAGVENCIKSLLNQDYKNFEIIAIDDMSDDNSYDFLKKKFGNKHNIIITKNKKRESVIGTCNNGIKIAKGKYVFRTDQDTIYEKNVLSELIKVITQYNDVAGVGCKLYYPNSNKIRALGIKINKLIYTSKVVGRNEIDRGQYDKIIEVDSLIGGAMMMKMDVLKKIGGFNEKYILYYNEVDWCLNAKKMGFRVLHVPTARAKKGGIEKELSSFSLYHMLRDKITFMKLHANKLIYYIFIFGAFLSIPIKVIRFALINRFDLIKAQVKGVWIGILYNETKYNKRSFIDGLKDI